MKKERKGTPNPLYHLLALGPWASFFFSAEIPTSAKWERIVNHQVL